MYKNPSKLFHRFFRWYCKPEMLSHLEGDLLELYHERIISRGYQKANWLFIRDVLVLFRPGIIRNVKINHPINTYSMFKSFLKIGWRNLVRKKTYAAINITGLAVGVAACLLIFLIVQFETTFDNFHERGDRIFRVVSATKRPDGMNYSMATAFPVAPGLKIDYPQLEKVARLLLQDGQQVTVMDGKEKVSEKKFKEDRLYFAEPSFFDIFHFPFIAGDPNTALAAPNAVVLTQSTAEKYFGDWHAALNQYIKYRNRKVCKVTGILQNMPGNTNFSMDLVFSFKTTSNDTSTDWVSQTSNLNTFVVLPVNQTAKTFDVELTRFVKKHTPAEYANQGYQLQALNDIHYNSQFGVLSGNTFSQELITTISLIGIFLLIIACVNFVNLATAQAVSRSREVGVRKVLGSSKGQLIAQFLSETFIITLIAVGIAIALAWLALPMLNRLLHIPLNMEFNGKFIGFIADGIVVVTLLAGFYPALVLSGFQPVRVLKSKFNGKVIGGLSVRRVLVVLQFTIAQALIIATLVAVKQMNFFKESSMGFNKEAIVTAEIPVDSISLTKLAALKWQLLQQPGIKKVSYSIFSPADNAHWGSDFKFDQRVKTTDFNADLKWADADYFNTYDIKFIAGHSYQESDTVTGFVVNRMLAKRLGFDNPAEILGKEINFWDGLIKARIVGVVEDFHGTTLAKQMKPTVLGSSKSTYQLVNIKLNPQQLKQTMLAIERLWNKSFPEYVYQYQFLDEKIASFYSQDDQLAQLYKGFALIAIFISCLGLYGLVSFMAVQKTREVGIRKVLGASVGHILLLFSREFILLIVLAFVIAAPAAYFFMHGWLENFAYRTTIGVGTFIVTIAAAVFIAWITVAYRSIQAAVAKPVDSLRVD